MYLNDSPDINHHRLLFFSNHPCEKCLNDSNTSIEDDLDDPVDKEAALQENNNWRLHNLPQGNQLTSLDKILVIADTNETTVPQGKENLQLGSMGSAKEHSFKHESPRKRTDEARVLRNHQS